MPSFELLAVIFLVSLAFGNLIVGVVNDAVNFLSSAIGAKVAPLKTIMIIAGIGIIIGSTFSDGIIEVARKGIFYPENFALSEAIIIFTAVAFADIILLDLFSTFGLPTSTTVSVVFELLGAALVLAWLKIGNLSEAWHVINSSSATKIILGILFSVAIAFILGLIAQFATRLIFTFDYKEKFKRWGFLWSGIALTSIIFFILIKGGKHATFMTPEFKDWIANSTFQILIICFVFFSFISLILIKIRANILKFIILIGTASLAMAFAGNDLANFIGFSVGGVHAFLGSDLSGTLPTPSWVLIIAGITMALSIAFSKKAKTVVKTSVNLCSHNKEIKKQWKPNTFSARLCNLVTFFYDAFLSLLPQRLKKWLSTRWKLTSETNSNGSAFDLLRASVNLIIAAAVISYATSHKLPLSTTYVTFMVAMGTSLADGAWDSDCAPYRITGILTVISGWFFTAFLAFVMAGVIVSILYFARSYGLLLLGIAVIVITYKLFHLHKKRDCAVVG
ncbi:inorganic phosphate transporter [Patescibacteria group bacterium]|nr:inorganic phosphate transporter [Patescibacteria group bacterium]